jgi:hypothetical protein
MWSIWQLSLGYFLSYIATGLAIKFFTGKAESGFFGLNSIEYLVYSTAFSSVFCVFVVLVLGWHRRARLTRLELITLGLSGFCTAYIIPTSTLIMSLPISIMVAMVLMRGSVIVASRLVDLTLNLQGIQHKKIPWQEEAAVVFSILAIGTKLLFAKDKTSQFPLIGVVLLFFYFFAYLLRLYIMNRSKLLGLGGGKKLDEKLYFGVEQLFASFTLLSVSILVYLLLFTQGKPEGLIGQQFLSSLSEPSPLWYWAALSGLPYSFIAFLSVFLFLYPGKTATFTGVLNRLVSLVGGTASSLILFLFFAGGFPPLEDWLALGCISAAIAFLAWGNSSEARSRRKERLALSNT